jgi:hypothetical protein
VFTPYESKIDNSTIFVGHSLGPAFILSILEKIDVKIKASFFVSGFIGLLNNPQFDEINKTFVLKGFDWKKIRSNCDKFYLFHSDNDPYVPLSKAKDLATKLDGNLAIVRDAGHFNAASGYTRFDLLLKKIEEII